MAAIREEWRLKLTAAWDISAQKKKPPTVSFATVALDGHPATRTMIFRGFREGTDQLMLVTDVRSSKVEQLTAHPWAEYDWYAEATDEQFRLAGNIRIVTHEEGDPSLQAVRDAVWNTLKPQTQALYFQPPPGRDKSDHSKETPEKPESGPPDTMCLLLLDPVRVDYLNQSTRMKERIIYRVGPAGDWFKRQVNP